MLLLFRKVSKKERGPQKKDHTHRCRPHTLLEKAMPELYNFIFLLFSSVLGFFFFFCYCVAIQVCCSSLRKTVLNKSVDQL